MLQLIHIADFCVLHCFCGLNYLPACFFFYFSCHVFARMVCVVSMPIYTIFIQGEKIHGKYLFFRQSCCALKNRSHRCSENLRCDLCAPIKKLKEEKQSSAPRQESCRIHLLFLSVLFLVKLTRTVVVYYQSSSLRKLTNFQSVWICQKKQTLYWQYYFFFRLEIKLFLKENSLLFR